MAYAAVWKHYSYTVVPGWRRGKVRHIPTPSFELLAIAGTRRDAEQAADKAKDAIMSSGSSRSSSMLTVKVVPVTTLPLLGITRADVTRYYAHALGVEMRESPVRWVIRKLTHGGLTNLYWHITAGWGSLGGATTFRGPSDFFAPKAAGGLATKGIKWTWERVPAVSADIIR